MSEGPAIGDWTQYGWIPDDASSFPARVRLRNTAWMVYYEPDTVVQQERAKKLELQAENAKLRGQYEAVIDDYRSEVAKLREQVDYMTPIALYAASEQERERMRELGIEVGI